MTNSGNKAESIVGKVAIIGMGCLFPGAPDLNSFWSNIVRGVDAIRDVSDKEWNVEDFYDPNAKSFGLSYSKRAGFISEHADFDPLKFGVMPSAVAGTDPDQLLTLRVAYEAMADAGYMEREFDRDRAEIILGRISAPGAGSMNLIHQSKTVHEIAEIVRNLVPDADDDLAEQVAQQLRERLATCSSDTIPGAMPNVLAGRIANKLGFRGRNLLIDAACASSMVAVETAVNDLLAGHCDFALAGGLHVNSSNVFFQMFCGLGALSRTDTISPFDESADGTLLGEGIGIICLKRYEDAIADGDKIYATICGVASSSDGHVGSVLSPSMEGEALAMEKAYKMSGISPRTVELLEAHGTATPTGDAVELKAVEKVFKSKGSDTTSQWCAVGSVKSMIGHCQSASAVAGIIKTALALHHKILPPTLNVKSPSSKIDWKTHPCYLNTQSRPWLKSSQSEHPRRAAVSAFGFGGINGHMILEEHESTQESEIWNLHQWDSEVFAFSSYIKDGIPESLNQLANFLRGAENVVLKDLAYSINTKVATGTAGGSPAHTGSENEYRLAIVATDQQDLLSKIDQSLELMTRKTSVREPEKGIYFNSPGTAVNGKLAFLYPGLGSAYTGMLSDLCMHFPEVREVFEIVDSVATAAGAPILPSNIIFPNRISSGRPLTESLASADFAVVAVLLAEYSLYQLLKHLGINPDVVMGCSTGEFAAITTGGAVDVLSVAEKFYSLSTRVARSIATTDDAKALCSMRILSSAEKVMSLVKNGDVYLNSDLDDNHIIVTGTKSGIEKLGEELKKLRITSQVLPIAIPYHTPLVSGMVDKNNNDVTSVDIQPLAVPAWSCSSAAPYPSDTEVMRTAFTELFSKPILMRQTINGMYEQGVRTFIEVGPNGFLTTLVNSILRERPHIVVASNLASRPALTQINHLVGVLFANGVNADFEFLFKRREPKLIDWQSPVSASSKNNKLDLRHTKLAIDPETISFPSSVPVDTAEKGALRTPLHSSPDTSSPDTSSPDTSSPDTTPTPTETPATPTEASPAGMDAVLESYMRTNATFYNRMATMQERVMKKFLAGETVDGEPVSLQASRSSYAFSDRFFVTPGDGKLQIELKVDLKNDLYLLDHAIGGFINTRPEQKVFLMPLMVSLEIMAESALTLRRNGFVTRVEQVKAFKRLVVDRDGLVLHMVVTENNKSVHVEMFDDKSMTAPVLVAEFVITVEHPQSNPPELHVTGEKPKHLLHQSDLYQPSAMFHGPLMQSVISLDVIGNRSISGVASAKQAAGWIPRVPTANFALHPLLLDNSSQFVLFYLYEKNLPAKALLPFFIESIEFFAPLNELSDKVFVSASLTTISEKSTEAKVEITDSNKQVLARINNINSRRITLSDEWIEYVHDPINKFLSKSLPLNNEMNSRCVLSKIDSLTLPQDESTLDWCLDYVLTKNERDYWRQNLKFEKRKIDWLIGRIAAKESVRRLVKERDGITLGPLDIEIDVDERKRPVVRIPQIENQILVSISHTNNIGFALAVFASDGSPGIDAETIDDHEPDFPDRFLNEKELQQLRDCSNEKRNAELTRLWTAKEAVFKSLGGTVELTALNIENFDVHSNVLEDLVLSYTLSNYTTAD